MEHRVANTSKRNFPSFLDAQKLYQTQLLNWDMFLSNHLNQFKAEIKFVECGSHRIILKNLPHRKQSTTAKLKVVPNERPCILCPQNLPREQEVLKSQIGFNLMVNPYPVVNHHFTIVNEAHVKQNFINHSLMFFLLAKYLEGMTLFYNAPGCGASIPEHHHFQAIPSNILPIEASNSENPWLCPNIYCESSDAMDVAIMISNAHSFIEKMNGENYDKFNIIGKYCNGKFMAWFIPREKARPACYALEGDKRILLSPASLELGGLWVLPEAEDMGKIDDKIVKAIYNEVCLNPQQFEALQKKSKEWNPL